MEQRGRWRQRHLCGDMPIGGPGHGRKASPCAGATGRDGDSAALLPPAASACAALPLLSCRGATVNARKHRSVGRIPLFIAAVISIIAPGTMAAASAHGAATPSDLVPGPAASNPHSPASSPLGTLPEAIQKIGETKFPGIYGGLAVTDSQHHMDVYLTSLSLSAELAIRRAASAGLITFLTTPHTRIQLLAIHAKVTEHAPVLARDGIHLVSWFPGINGNGVENIGVLNLTARAVRTLNRTFGPDNIVLHNVTRSEVPVSTAGRNSDFAPWNGGDNLTSNGLGCASGVRINYAAQQYIITAAHCYEPGWSIYNA